MTDHPATATPTAHAWAAAQATDREARALREDLVALRAEASALRAEATVLRERHEQEHADVEGLRGLGLRSVLSSLRGTKRGELDREEAEAASARADALAGLSRLHDVEARAEAIDQRLARLGDTTAPLESAAQAYAEELRGSGHPVAVELDGVLTELSTAREQLARLEAVRAAGARAMASLDAARAELTSADRWSTYDTFAGGGMLSSVAKHQHVDSASRGIATAQHAIVELAGALRDVAEVADLRADLGVSDGTRTMDVWLDNIATDWRVRSRIKDQLAGVERASSAVREAMGRLVADHAHLTTRVEELVRARDRLLGA